MKIERLYRLAYKSCDKSLESEFYTTKQEALSYLEKMKDSIQELYEWDDGMPLDGIIALQAINLEEVEDIQDFADEIWVSEWVEDKETTEQYRKDMLKEGIAEDVTFGKWEDR